MIYSSYTSPYYSIRIRVIQLEKYGDKLLFPVLIQFFLLTYLSKSLPCQKKFFFGLEALEDSEFRKRVWKPGKRIPRATFEISEWQDVECGY